jgi:hypothetical protein
MVAMKSRKRLVMWLVAVKEAASWFIPLVLSLHAIDAEISGRR